MNFELHLSDGSTKDILADNKADAIKLASAYCINRLRIAVKPDTWNKNRVSKLLNSDYNNASVVALLDKDKNQIAVVSYLQPDKYI